jgi:hypothetical protein
MGVDPDPAGPGGGGVSRGGWWGFDCAQGSAGRLAAWMRDVAGSDAPAAANRRSEN